MFKNYYSHQDLPVFDAYFLSSALEVFPLTDAKEGKRKQTEK